MYPNRSGNKNSHWNGGIKINHGYIYRFNPTHPFSNKDGYVYEHRLVMEKFLNRLLDSKERVHHRNHIKTDNRIENLELFSSQREHIAKMHPDHIKTAWKNNPQHNLTRWSVKYDKCIKCGSNKTIHEARGLCRKCYDMWLYYRRHKNSSTQRVAITFQE